MSENRFYATGHRKNAVARVWLQPGEGKITINRRPLEEYVNRKSLEMLVKQPFEATNTWGRFDVIATAKGGGVSGQVGAVIHGIARALVKVDEGFRSVLKKLGLLTRDPRVKERKKYGRKRARRGFQYSKR